MQWQSSRISSLVYWPVDRLEDIHLHMLANGALQVPSAKPLEIGSWLVLQAHIETTEQVIELLGHVVELTHDSRLSKIALTAPWTATVHLDEPSAAQLSLAFAQHYARRSHDSSTIPARYPIGRGGVCFVDHTLASYPAQLVDGSLRGAFFECDGSTRPGDSIYYCDQNENFWHQGVVQWRGEKNARSGMGVRMFFEDNSALNVWQRYIRHNAV